MDSAVVYTRNADSVGAGRDLSASIASILGAPPPDAVILFASPVYEAETLLRTVDETCRPGVLVGASSAGEFTQDASGTSMACALALRSPDLRFAAGIGRGLSRNPAKTVREIAGAFRGLTDATYAYRSALVMTDALAGHADQLIEELTLFTAGQYQFFGGGAGDDAQFRRTQVFCGREALSDAAVALEILSKKPIGIGVSHGWEPASKGLRVTEVSGMRLVSLNGLPAVEAFHAHARSTGQKLDTESPVPFFLHNILGVQSGSDYRLRVPLAVKPDGSVVCASEIPEGAIVHIMRATERSAVSAAERATDAALKGIGEGKPKAALFFDCVATRLRLQDGFGFELKAIADRLGGADFAGCNTHGQIARAEGQFSGFHNCTAVVCIFPE